MTDLPSLPQPRLGRYRHYKGGEYEVVGVARHSETLVVYRPLYNQTGLWVRPYDMFFGQVELEGRLQPRFAPLPGAPVASAGSVGPPPAPANLQCTDSPSK
jgi:hypothetical protein